MGFVWKGVVLEGSDGILLLIKDLVGNKKGNRYPSLIRLDQDFGRNILYLGQFTDH